MGAAWKFVCAIGINPDLSDCLVQKQFRGLAEGLVTINTTDFS